MAADAGAPNIASMATLLVADDLVPIRQMVRITLSTQGWTILEAKNGSEALEMAKANKPDLILLDVDMGPGPNGFEVCKTIKADPATKEIPVVMLTAHESDSDRAIGFAAGATQYLTKPFGPLELIDTIRGILAHS
jgi:CheY-like chemotaxis protein